MESTPIDKARLRGQLAALAARGVYLGTSSWKYTYVFINNRLEGCAPRTIQALVDGMPGLQMPGT